MILILAILAAILVPAILNYVGKARDSKNQANARSFYSEISVALATGVGSEPSLDDIKARVDEPSLDCEATFSGTEWTYGATLEDVTCGGWIFNGLEITQ